MPVSGKKQQINYGKSIRIFKHRARTQMIAIKRLPVSVCHKEWLFQSFQQSDFPNIFRRVVNKYTWFYISIRIDMAVVSSTCDTASDKLQKTRGKAVKKTEKKRFEKTFCL